MPESARILLVDDDALFLALCRKRLQRLGYHAFTASSGIEANRLVSEQEFDLLLLDLHLPDGSGCDLAAEMKNRLPDVPIMVFSGDSDVPNVVKAIQSGASDYITKPISFEALHEKIKSLVLYRKTLLTEDALQKEEKFSHLIGKSHAVKRLVAHLSRLAHSDAPVLLRGESGTGKSLIAQLMHMHSFRKMHPFVTVNCAAIPEELLESELFGYEKGAFTGAFRTKTGRCEFAEHGTLFLDEIGELSPRMQAKILRLIQSQEFERVGGLKTIQIDVRLIAATNRNLEALIAEGKFREDLFYRLNVLPVVVPPLRERREDIAYFVNYFLQLYAEKNGKQFHTLAPDVMEWLTRYSWPGNIRELENIVQRAVIVGKEPTLTRSDFALPHSYADSSFAKNGYIHSVDEIEQQVLLKALRDNGGNISKAAKQVGISRDTVYRRLKKYGIASKQH